MSVMKSINMYTKSGMYVKTFENQATASKELGITSSSINMCLHNKRLTAGGYIFKFLNTDFPKNKNIVMTKRCNSMPVMCSLNTGHIVKIYNSPQEACDVLGFKNLIDIYKKCNNDIIVKKEYFLVWYTDNIDEIIQEKYYRVLRHSKRVREIKNNKTIRYFNSLNSMQKELGLSHRTVVKMVNEKINYIKESDYALAYKNLIIN